MKNALLLISAISLLSFSAMAGEKTLIKICSTELAFPGETQIIKTKFEFHRNVDKTLSATTIQLIDGELVSETEVASIVKNSVRPGLVGELNDDETLNLAEQLISHAMLLSEDPMFEGVFSAGIDLKKVRSAKIYTIGEATNMGQSAIVEAKDQNGKILGSFLSGMLVHPCK